MDFSYNQKPRRQGMASMALILGLLSVFLFQTVFLPLMFGATAIVLAVLSKGYTKKMLGTAKVAITFAIGGISISVALIGSVFYLFVSQPQIFINYGKQYDVMYERIYGVSSEESLGTSYEEMISQYIDMFQNMTKGVAYDN